MIGPILVFLAVCALVTIYMAIVRSFLHTSEKQTSAEPTLAEKPVVNEQHEESPSRHPQWAH